MPQQPDKLIPAALRVAAAALAGILLLLPFAALAGVFDLKPMLPSDQYGNILIDRTSTANNVKPVIFSHWIHRQYYTCRVCHSELDFNFKVNTTEITEGASRAGKFCGACHNGRIAFRHVGNCEKCHTGDLASGSERYQDFLTKPFPFNDYGNGIDWVEAYRRKMINPATYLKKKSLDIPFEKTLFLESDWSIITPCVFPHKAHIEWLECGSCHPELFNIKKKSTKNLNMRTVLQGQFCGVCHLNVAFPMDDCKRCHPQMKENGP